jgi:uncharacterized membrane protein YgcG
MKRRMLRVTVGISVLLLLAPFGFSKSYQASRFDVALAIEAGGDLLVTEMVDFQFEGGPFTYFFREVPVKQSDGLDEFQGFMDGQKLRIGAGEMPGLELQHTRDSVRAVWHFLPTSDASHTLVLKYRARGAVRRAQGSDLLLWMAIHGNHPYLIESARVTVRYPPGIRLSGPPGANRKTTVATSGQTITYHVGLLTKDHGFTVEVPFVQGSVLTHPPLWQQRSERRTAEIWEAVKVAMAVEGPLLVIGVLLIVRLRSARAVPPVSGSATVTSPPDDPSPMLVGIVRGSWSDWRVGLATLIDLGQRGFLEIEARPKRWWRGREFTLRRKGDPAALNEAEKVLLRLVFGTAEAYAPEVSLGKAQALINRHWKEFTRALREEARASGFLDVDRENTRRKWIVTGLVLMLFALAGVGVSLVAVLPQVRPTPIVFALVFGGGLFILGLLVLTSGSTLTRLTDAALDRKQHWDAFRKYLKDLVSQKGRLQPDWLESYLPYAVVLGLGNQWAKAFKDRGMSTHLGWLVGTDQFDGSEVAALVAVLSSSGAGHSAPGGGPGGGGGAGGGGGSSGAG